MPDTNEMSVGYATRPTDEPDIPHPSLLAMQEIDSLREELRHERYKRMLAEGELARLKYEQAYPEAQSFLGFQMRSHDASDDDCLRTSWELKIDGIWHEVVTCGLSFNEEEAFNTLVKILRKKLKNK